MIRRVDDLGRVAIPKEMREKLGIKVGDPLEFTVVGETIMITLYKPSDETYTLISELRHNLDTQYPTMLSKHVQELKWGIERLEEAYLNMARESIKD